MFMIPGSEFDRLNSLAPWTRYMPSPYPLRGLQAISSFFIFNLLYVRDQSLFSRETLVRFAIDESMK